MYRYYDIHTHQEAGPQDDRLLIRNVHTAFEQMPGPQHCSAGLHPWYLDHADADLAALQQYIRYPQVMAVGECGLDKIAKTDWQQQCRVFEIQIDLANQYNKPLILHCVRAYGEVLALLQRHQVKVPVIFHGFRKNEAVARPLLAAGCYLSFGTALLNDAATLASTLQAVPANRFFLETDDAPVSIDSIYQAAARIRKTPEDAIILQLRQNFKTVFSI